MQDLGNKKNPFLAGLTGLGEGFLQGYLQRMKMNQEQQQIDFSQRRMSLLDLMNQHQNDLENEFKRTDDARLEKVATAQIKNMEDDNARLSVPKQPEYTTTTVPDSKTGKEKTYSHIKDTEFGSPSWKLIGDKPIYKPDGDKEPKDIYGNDLAQVESYIADIENLRGAAKSEDGGIYPAGSEKALPQSEYDMKYVQPVKNRAKIYTSKLIRNSGLSEGIKIIKGYMSKGKDLNTALKYFKEDNPDLTADDEKILASYFYLENL